MTKRPYEEQLAMINGVILELEARLKFIKEEKFAYVSKSALIKMYEDDLAQRNKLKIKILESKGKE